MNIDVRLVSLTESAGVLDRMSKEWRDTVSKISEITGEISGAGRLAECSEYIKEYSELLYEIVEKYENNEKNISVMSGDAV